MIGSSIKRSDSSSEKLKIFDSLTSRPRGYRYLGFNISLSIFLVWGLSLLKKVNGALWISVSSFGGGTVIAAFVLAVFTWGISHWNAKRTLSKLEKASEQNQKHEGDR